MSKQTFASSRRSGLYERHCISRQQLGFYSSLAVAGIYLFDDRTSQLLRGEQQDQLNALKKPLNHCIQKHPALSAVIDNADTNAPSFRQLDAIQLLDHFEMVNIKVAAREGSEDQQPKADQHDQIVALLMEHIHNTPVNQTQAVPAWKLFVCPIEDSSRDVPARFAVAYAYAHSHGDGLSGLLFHRTFLEGLSINDPQLESSKGETGLIVRSPASPLPPAIDTVTPLPISWRYLLGALSVEFSLFGLPKVFRIGQSSAVPTLSIWTGAPHFVQPDLSKTRTQILSVSQDNLTNVLSKCKSNDAKLTSVLHILFVNSILAELKSLGQHFNALKVATPIDLRRAAGLSSDAMGVMASVASEVCTSCDPTSPQFWVKARKSSALFASKAKTTQDQPVGLLRYVSSPKKWYESKMGRPRGTSYELSNLMVFDPRPSSPPSASEQHGKIEEMFFSQPGDVTGPALSFNVVSTRGAGMTISVSRQSGALGLTDQPSTELSQEHIAKEDDFVSHVLDRLHKALLTF